MNTETAQATEAALFAVLAFAARKHRSQRRKDKEASPFIDHPIAVADTLVRVGGVTDPMALQGALLHDTLEDTATTAAELDEHFGQPVRLLVEEVTDDKSLPESDRKRLQVERAGRLSPLAKQIRVADKICNIAELDHDQPVGWSSERKQRYLTWAAVVVNACRGCNAALEARFDELLGAKRRLLGAAD
jgi:guanosine-3',5'-bis(diphosphate) 3'-pyrophosphohydrolase